MERFSSEVRQKIKKDMKKAGIDTALVGFVDIDGQILKGRPVVMSEERINNLPMSGPSFTGGSVPGAGQGPEHPEMVAYIDPNSYIPPMKWMPKCGFFMASLFVQGQPHPYDPRGNLERVLTGASQGYVFNMGVEPEHYIITRDGDGKIHPWNPRFLDGAAMPGYNLNAIVPILDYLLTMKDNMGDLGWEPYQVDHEDGFAQCEINWKYASALITCDRLMYFRYMARHVCYQELGDGVSVTFKPKPFPQFCGSGLHIHYHLACADSGKNLFLDDKDPRGLGLSEFAYHFLAGIIEHSDALCALGNPTHQCYERLHPTKTPDSGNHWVPVKKFISDDNRTVMIRVPEGGHCEDRSPSAACNPYLLVAAYIAAGLDGVKKKLPAPEPLFCSAFTTERETGILPKTLSQALDAFEQDPVVRGALGPIAEVFLERKRKEKEEYKSDDAFSFF